MILWVMIMLPDAGRVTSLWINLAHIAVGPAVARRIVPGIAYPVKLTLFHLAIGTVATPATTEDGRC